MAAYYMEQDYDMVFRMVIVGDSGVGKTSFLHRYTSGTYMGSSKTTIGLDIGTKEETVDGKKLKVQIVDTAGRKELSASPSLYYQDVKAIMLMYDITNHQSFENITKRWLPEIENEYKELEGTPPVTMLVGHKYDLRPLRTVTFEQGYELARKHDMRFIEASSLDGDNSVLSFEWLFIDVLKRFPISNSVYCEPGNRDVESGPCCSIS